MTAYASRAQLVALHMPQRDVHIPSLGVSVRVRGLSRAEVLAFDDGNGARDREIALLTIGCVSPRLDPDDAAAWHSAGGMQEIESVCDAIMELSGLRQGQAKEVYAELAADPDAEFRDAASAEPRDDAVDAAPGDE